MGLRSQDSICGTAGPKTWVLSWHDHESITDVRREVVARLRSAGLEVAELRSSDTFSVLQVRHSDESVVVDLVAEPVAAI